MSWLNDLGIYLNVELIYSDKFIYYFYVVDNARCAIYTVIIYTIGSRNRF